MTHQFTIEVGRLLRQTVKREIRSGAVLYGLGCEIEEIKGWLDSTLVVTLEGEADKIRTYLRAVNKWVEDNQ